MALVAIAVGAWVWQQLGDEDWIMSQSLPPVTAPRVPTAQRSSPDPMADVLSAISVSALRVERVEEVLE
jgi:hypothetical protein